MVSTIAHPNAAWVHGLVMGNIMSGHWMEGDWPDVAEDTPKVKAMKRLLKAAKDVVARCAIADDDGDELLCEFDDAINDAESFLYPEDDDPRSMGWVGDNGLP